ncbi:hypothetical protein ACRVZG_18215 [Bacillus tropicus]|uniref:hypothetical protein n=1 Tax=Bacillus TaxID=1386 RepID=UPI001CCC60B1|nr:hypothetical protein [Bacillus sp. CRB-7]UBM49752.1 hypothetical protein K8M08_22675 [Bacillus sp. CRB-7]
MSIKDKFDLMNIPEDTIKEVWEVITDSHELVNTLSEFNPYLSFINNRVKKRKEKKFKEFLKGFAIMVFSSEQITSTDLKTLEDLLNKKQNKNVVLDILEEALATVSDTSSKILGIIAGEVLKGDRKFDYNDWILVNGLKNMNEWDIESFNKVYSYFEAYPKKTRVTTTMLLQNVSLEEYGKLVTDPSTEEYKQFTNDPSVAEKRFLEEEERIMKSEEYKRLRSSLMRINSFQILMLGPITVEPDSVNFERSYAGDELYKLIKEIEEIE